MRPKPKLSALEKKIKPNPRYNGVEPVVNTGANLRLVLLKQAVFISGIYIMQNTLVGGRMAAREKNK